MIEPKQLKDITYTNWCALLAEKHPEAFIVTTSDTAYAYLPKHFDTQYSYPPLGGHCSSGNYGWVQGV